MIMSCAPSERIEIPYTPYVPPAEPSAGDRLVAVSNPITIPYTPVVFGQAKRQEPATDFDWLPEVTFDVELGKRYKQVDFDYDLFRETAQELGIKNGLEAVFRVHYSARRPSLAAGFFHGRTIVVEDLPLSNRNKVLTHELQHGADALNRNLVMDDRYLIGKAAGRAMLNVGAPLTLFSAWYVRSAEEGSGIITPEAMNNLSSLFLVSAAVLFLWGYRYHPSERRAFKAEKQSTRNVATFEKR